MPDRLRGIQPTRCVPHTTISILLFASDIRLQPGIGTGGPHSSIGAASPKSSDYSLGIHHDDLPMVSSPSRSLSGLLPRAGAHSPASTKPPRSSKLRGDSVVSFAQPSQGESAARQDSRASVPTDVKGSHDPLNGSGAPNDVSSHVRHPPAKEPPSRCLPSP